MVAEELNKPFSSSLEPVLHLKHLATLLFLGPQKCVKPCIYVYRKMLYYVFYGLYYVLHALRGFGPWSCILLGSKVATLLFSLRQKTELWLSDLGFEVAYNIRQPVAAPLSVCTFLHIRLHKYIHTYVHIHMFVKTYIYICIHLCNQFTQRLQQIERQTSCESQTEPKGCWAQEARSHSSKHGQRLFPGTFRPFSLRVNSSHGFPTGPWYGPLPGPSNVIPVLALE